MTKPVGLLSILLAVTAANAAPAPTSDISGPQAPATALAVTVLAPTAITPILLAAAGGHDSVGGLMPLPLCPPYAPRAYVPAPQVWKHKPRKCSAHACPH
jgi:hypothetical protein